MATLVLTAVGTAIGGPLGGAVGSLIGSQIDQAIFKPSGREGPRLKELSVTTSSYGTPIARHFGKMRAAGSIIWATDLAESSEKSGGGKGRPSTTTFSYSTSFAVALSSRPVASIGRIWADGNLLRGAAGDLKVGGEFRFYSGYGNQQPDALLANAEGGASPAYRGLAYCVFETLQLADFGNRIPALTFEVIAEEGEVSLLDVLAPVSRPLAALRPLEALAGFSDEGGSILATLETIDQIYPFACDTSGNALELLAEDSATPAAFVLPEAVVDPEEENFGSAAGYSSRRQADQRRIPAGLRFYDLERDFLAGLQHAGGRALPGQNAIIEFPGALNSASARQLANEAADRATWAHEVLHWRIAEIDPDLAPGSIVQVPGRAGSWRVEAWEWRETGLELELIRQSHATNPTMATDPGRVLSASDELPTPTVLQAFELPWDGTGSPDERQVFAAPSSESDGWTGAALFTDIDGNLSSIGPSGNDRSIIGITTTQLKPGSTHIVDRASSVQVQLVSDDFLLSSRSLSALAQGENRALIGSEIVQFASAADLGNGRWLLSNFLRGRGGTEHFAALSCDAGAQFALLDNRPVALAPGSLGNAQQIVAIGIADPDPVTANIVGLGSTLKPLTPVHPQVILASTGGLTICWTRRARGSLTWAGTVEVPLAEQSELYEVGLGPVEQPSVTWQVAQPQLSLSQFEVSQLSAAHPGASVWVRQIGTHARSEPLLLLTLS